MAKLLLEIGSEEIPASYIPSAAEKLKEKAGILLEKKFLPYKELRTFGSPRRLVLVADGIPPVQEKRTRKVSGPPAKVALDKDGHPTGAGLGFAKKFGKDFSEVQVESTPKGDYLYLLLEEGGGKTGRLLEKLLPSLIEEIPFPKTMRWGNGTTHFARPIRSIVALLDSEILKFRVGSVSSGNITFGHRFLSNGAITIDSPGAYEETLRNACAIVSPEQRKRVILEAFEKTEKENSVRIISDEELLEEVRYLTEYPVAVFGGFDENFLELPRELLITVFKHHQKFFAVEDADGKLANRFVAISNILTDSMPDIQKGFERVLSARLSDARFFFDEDRKHKLAEFAEKLGGIRYQKGLGTIADKTARVSEIAATIADTLCPDKKRRVALASALAKADLTTSMVYEFPELQGVMGREYALAEGISEPVARAIDEHYLPRFSGDALPSNDTAVCVALADKLETVCGFFALGKIPTGSEDPFSLRRHALGIVRILLGNKKEIPLSGLISAGINQLPDEIVADCSNLKNEILSFFEGRIKAEFTALGMPYDVVDAVLAAGFEFLPDTLQRCEALAEMKKENYSENLSITFKRAAHIVKGHDSAEIDERLLEDEVEKKLWNAVSECEKEVAPLLERNDYSAALIEIAKIRNDVDNFFDGVMVMADDARIRDNRLGLLRRVTKLFEKLADFSRLVFA